MTAMRIAISDPGDARLAPYRDIRERDLIRHDGMFIAEGKSVLAVLVAMQHRFNIVSVLVLENRLGSVETILEKLSPDIPVLVVDRRTIDAIAGFPMHRGILACVRRPAWCDATGALIDPALGDPSSWRRVVALSEIANHDNMGSIFRNAAAFGVDAVVFDARSCDPLYRKAIRVSVGGILKVPFLRFSDTPSMLDWLANQGFDIYGLSPGADHSLEDWRPSRRSALLLGAEGPGLAPDTMARINMLKIGMVPGFDSLNVATASGIALHALMVAHNKENGRQE